MSAITTILTVYKRPYLEEQLEKILSQTISSDIVVWQNENHVDISRLRDKYKFTHIQSNNNWKFHGRFTVPLLLNTKYICIFDDDTMPQSRWLEKCLRSCEEKNAIIGRNGRVIMRNLSQSGPIPHGEDLLVDFVGHSWFFKREWIHYMWRSAASTFENGEDIHFCASAKIHGDIQSYIAGSSDPEEQATQNGKDGSYGNDQFAHYLVHKDVHNPVRKQVYSHWLKSGWKTIHFPDGLK